ncbi:MAG: GNAT family N-acetyltransferase [Dehalococcoidia bacterium]
MNANPIRSDRDLALRVELQPADGASIERMRTWLPDALAAGAGGAAIGTQAEAPADGSRPYAVVHRRSKELLGYLSLLRGEHESTVSAIAIAPQHRNLGYGAEAVFAAERLHVGLPASRALVPLENGLAVYFWLRIGYQPIFASRHGRAGVTVMERRSVIAATDATVARGA